MKLIILGFALAFCGCQKKMTEKAALAKPNYAIYQLKNGTDLAQVPVTLDEQKQNIVAYPSPKDLAQMSNAVLHDGWVIDLRGVNAQSAFVAEKINEYIEKNEMPNLTLWQESITNKNPFVYFYQCPGALDLNAIKKIIEQKKWSNCTCLVKPN
jgi:hypothetical protein